MVVYLDVLFLVNFLMNYFIISICTAIVPNRSKYKRKILASILGGIYGVGIFIPEMNFMYSVISLFGFSVGLVAIIFCPCRFRDFLKILAVFYISTFMLSGGIFMLMPFFGGGVFKNNIIYIKSGYLIVFAGLVAALIVFGMKYVKKNFGRKEYNIRIKYRDNSVEGFGIFDSGNELKDPTTGAGVIVIDKNMLEGLFLKGVNEFNLGEWIDARDIRVIPYKTVGNEGVMMGFLADEVILDGRKLGKVTIAISPEDLKERVLINCENF